MKEYHIAVKGQQPGAFDEENDRHNAHAVKYPSDNRLLSIDKPDRMPVDDCFHDSGVSIHKQARRSIPGAILLKMYQYIKCFVLGLYNMVRSAMFDKLLSAKHSFATVAVVMLTGFCLSACSDSKPDEREFVYAVDQEFARFFRSGSWNQVYQKYAGREDGYYYSGTHYSDGTPKASSSVTTDEVCALAFNSLWRDRFVGDGYDAELSYSSLSWLNDEISKLDGLHPDDEAGRAELNQLKNARAAWYYQYDSAVTFFMTSVLANGKTNPQLSQAIETAVKLRKQYPEDKQLQAVTQRLTALYAEFRKIEKHLTPQCQLKILNDYERELHAEPGFSPSPDVLRARKALRAAINDLIGS